MLHSLKIVFSNNGIGRVGCKKTFEASMKYFNPFETFTPLTFCCRYNCNNSNSNNVHFHQRHLLYKTASPPIFTQNYLNLKSEPILLYNVRSLYISSRSKQNKINVKTKSDEKSKTLNNNSSVKNSHVNDNKRPVANGKISDHHKDISNGDKNGTSKTPTDPANEEVAKESIFTRFKNTYKQHGKIFIGVHLVTSAMWTGIFYYAVASGVDIVAMLDWMGVSQSVIDKFKSPKLGLIATTYLLYKIATPLRYTVTIAGTRWVVKYMQSSGKMPTTPVENKITSLLKEGGNNIKKRPKFRRKNK